MSPANNSSIQGLARCAWFVGDVISTMPTASTLTCDQGSAEGAGCDMLFMNRRCRMLPPCTGAGEAAR